MKFTGQLITGDFEDNTMTFEIEGPMTLQAGKYIIIRIDDESKLKNLGIADVVGRSEQLKCKHEPKSNRKFTSCRKCGMPLQLEP